MRVFIVSLAFAALICAAVPLVAEEQPSAEKLMDDLMWSRGPIGGPFTLTDHTGRTRSDGVSRQADADLFRLHLLS